MSTPIVTTSIHQQSPEPFITITRVRDRLDGGGVAFILFPQKCTERGGDEYKNIKLEIVHA